MFHVNNYDPLFSHTGKFSFETSVRKSVSFIQYGQELILILPKFDVIIVYEVAASWPFPFSNNTMCRKLGIYIFL